MGCYKVVIEHYRCGHADKYWEMDESRYATNPTAKDCPDYDGNEFRGCYHLGKHSGCCMLESQQKQADEKYADKREVA